MKITLTTDYQGSLAASPAIYLDDGTSRHEVPLLVFYEEEKEEPGRRKKKAPKEPSLQLVKLHNGTLDALVLTLQGNSSEVINWRGWVDQEGSVDFGLTTNNLAEQPDGSFQIVGDLTEPQPVRADSKFGLNMQSIFLSSQDSTARRAAKDIAAQKLKEAEESELKKARQGLAAWLAERGFGQVEEARPAEGAEA